MFKVVLQIIKLKKFCVIVGAQSSSIIFLTVQINYFRVFEQDRDKERNKFFNSDYQDIPPLTTWRDEETTQSYFSNKKEINNSGAGIGKDKTII